MPFIFCWVQYVQNELEFLIIILFHWFHYHVNSSCFSYSKMFHLVTITIKISVFHYIHLGQKERLNYCNTQVRYSAFQFTTNRAHLKCDGTRAETRFRLSGKRTSPFKSAGESVQSTTGSQGVRISGSNGSNAGYTMFWGKVKHYWLPTPLARFPFTSPPVRHRVPSGFNWTLPDFNKHV